MGYLEAWSIWEGALDQELSVDGEDETGATFQNWLKEIKEAAEKDNPEGSDVAVYTIYHDHEQEDEGCECVQYLTDHHPYWSTEPDDN